jgi:hypothetical protein
MCANNYTGTSGANGNGSASEDEENSELESQDENDLGHGARPGGGFTSAVSVWVPCLNV